MVNFEYNTPTRVVFGSETEKRTGELAKKYGAKKILLHFGSDSAVKSGLIDRIETSIKDAGLKSVRLGGVVPNPLISKVREGAELCKKEKVDFILAVGGGSVIDSAKAIGYAVLSASDAWDYFSGKAVPVATLPVAAVLTIAAAGSEMSNSCVITNDETHEKRAINNELGRCVFAIMNPQLTVTVPFEHTLYGCADIMMHTLERYFTSEETMQLTDEIAEALLRTVMEKSQILARNLDNYEARAEIMWAGSLSHNDLTGCGGGSGDWSSHQLGHEISGHYNTPHGAALTTIWGSWARFVAKTKPERFVRLGVNVLGIDPGGDVHELAIATIEEIENFFWGLELPTSFADLGIDMTDELADKLAESCSRAQTRTVGDYVKLDKEMMKKIYLMAKEEK